MYVHLYLYTYIRQAFVALRLLMFTGCSASSGHNRYRRLGVGGSVGAKWIPVLL